MIRLSLELLKTTTTMGSSYFTAVVNSPMPMTKSPSPTPASTWRSGKANFAPMA
ncbi:hypothetical protein D3C72_2584110 [compost metagenome]